MAPRLFERVIRRYVDALQFTAEPAPPPTATCTRPAATAAARRVAAGGAGRTRQSRSAGWSRPGCWPPARWPSLGSSPAPAAADHEAKQQAELGEERWLLLDQLPTQVTTRGHQRPDRWAGPSGAWPPTPSAGRPAGRRGVRPAHGSSRYRRSTPRPMTSTGNQVRGLDQGYAPPNQLRIRRPAFPLVTAGCGPARTWTWDLILIS